MFEIYGLHDQQNGIHNGGIVSLNILKYDGSYLGYYQVFFLYGDTSPQAQTDFTNHNIHVRTGCHCNPGACRLYLKQNNDEIKEYSMIVIHDHLDGQKNEIVAQILMIC